MPRDARVARVVQAAVEKPRPLTLLEVITPRRGFSTDAALPTGFWYVARAGCEEVGGQCRVGGQLAHPLEAYRTVETARVAHRRLDNPRHEAQPIET